LQTGCPYTVSKQPHTAKAGNAIVLFLKFLIRTEQLYQSTGKASKDFLVSNFSLSS